LKPKNPSKNSKSGGEERLGRGGFERGELGNRTEGGGVGKRSKSWR